MSKTYSMPGWRIGFAAGNRKLIGALARVKSYLDYGAFTAVQVAATAAFNGPQDCIQSYRQIYQSAEIFLIKRLNDAGWQCSRRRPPCLPGFLFHHSLSTLVPGV